MRNALRVSRLAWLALAISGALAAVGWAALWRWRPVAPVPSGELAALIAEREHLRGNEDAVRDALRDQRDTLRSSAWTAERLAQLKAEIGSGWKWVGERPDRVLLHRGGLPLGEWPRCLELIAALSAQPGVAVESLELRARGRQRERSFAEVRIGLRFIVAGAPVGDAERAAPSRGPLPVAPADSPAASRKLGPVTSLRRPDASAKPPAFGPASASFRPDPPGPRAGPT